MSGFILLKLHIIWPSLKILSTMTKENYQLPSSIPLTWTESKTLRGILMKLFWCLFVTKFRDKYAILSLPARRWDVAPAYGHINQAMSISNPVLYPRLGEAETKF